MGVATGVRWIRVDDGVVIFVPQPAQFIDLNESAGELWDVLERGDWTPSIAIEHLAVTYGMASPEAQQVVESFLSDLGRRGVITAPA